jgi:hypothetical protein
MPQVGDLDGANMGLSNKRGTSGVSSALRIILLLAFGIYAFAFGCTPATIWSAEARSPDGKIIASARATGANGFGNGGGIHTFAYLNWTTDSQPPTLILDLVDNTTAPADTNVEMKWLTPTHLELTYAGNRVLGFQAVKWAGVDISVRTLTSAASNTSQ